MDLSHCPTTTVGERDKQRVNQAEIVGGRGEREGNKGQRERGRGGERLPVGCWRIPDRLIQHLCSSLEYLCRDIYTSDHARTQWIHIVKW